MECNEIKEYLYEYETKRLAEPISKEINKHLEKCDQCQLELGELRETLTMLQYAKSPKLPEKFKDKVISEIHSNQRKTTRWKWVLQGTVAATIVLAAVTIYRITLPPEGEKIPRGILIVTEPSKAEHPIIIETRDVSKTVEETINLIKKHNGQLVRKVLYNSKAEITCQLAETAESAFFQELGQLGEMKEIQKGYKEAQGNIMIVLVAKDKS